MPRRTRRPGCRIAASTYLELLRSLFKTVVSSAIMGVLFIVTSWICAANAADPRLTAIAAFGSMVAVLRVAIIARLRVRVADSGLDLKTGRAAERVYAGIYLTFAAVIGLFGGLGLLLCAVEYHMVIAALVVGYGAGVAAGLSLRPWIGIPAFLLGVTPVILSALSLADTEHLLLAAVLMALMIGGVRSMAERYRTAVQMIEMRHLFGSLARQDPLTGLANRFALEEALAKVSADVIVLHCIDLDRFKEVNDVHGHPVGDLLLKAVANRLKRLLRSGDLAIRLGGDEFAVLQTGIEHEDESKLLARRIVRAIAEPYSIGGQAIEIGASIGSAAGREHGSDLTALLGVADVALYKVKHSRCASHALAG